MATNNFRRSKQDKLLEGTINILKDNKTSTVFSETRLKKYYHDEKNKDYRQNKKDDRPTSH